MSQDVLRLRSMRFVGRHGAFDWERLRGQPFEVDVEIHRDLAGAGRSDDLGQAVDYAAVRDRVEAVVTGPSVHLVEALAERIAEAVGRGLGPMDLVVRVRKPQPPVPGRFEGVEVEIRRHYA
ncbi:MAG: dihydroneopterin aldolase [Gemmatimonadota bacterium]